MTNDLVKKSQEKKSQAKEVSKGGDDVIGFVESIHGGEVVGWVVSQSSAPIEVSVVVKGKKYAVDVVWHDRSDVPVSVRGKQSKIGFAFKLIDEKENSLIRYVDEFDVIINGTLLPLSESFILIEGVVELVDKFRISGWVAGDGRPLEMIDLRINGNSAGCTAIRKERADVSEVLGVECLELGFEFELPNQLWEISEEANKCHIDLVDSKGRKFSKTILLTKEMAAGWVKDVASMEEGRDKQYLSLLALEHTRFGGLSSCLDKTSLKYLLNFSEKMNLDGYLGEISDGNVGNSESFEGDANTLILWKALIYLNNRLDDGSKTVFEHVRETQEEMRLTGVVKRSYHKSVISLLCRHDQFMHMRRLTGFPGLYDLDHGGDLWDMSLALAPLMADGLVDRASDLLWRLSKQLDNGWLNTECIYFAVRHLQLLEHRGDVDIQTAERFRYAVFGLLDAFCGEWFSRLHDQSLVDAVIVLVAGIEQYTDYHRHDLVDAAIKYYGLSPTFWQRFTEAAPNFYHSELAAAMNHWQGLYAVLTRRDKPLVELLDQLQVPLRYFQKKNNRESIIFLREIITNTLPEISRTSDLAGLELVQRVLDSTPAEAMRVAAFPLPNEDRIRGEFPEIQEQLYDTLRQITERPDSVVYQLQKELAACLKEVNAAVNGDAMVLSEALKILRYKAAKLGNWEANFLGVDLLVNGLMVACEAGEDVDPWLMIADDFIKKAIDESKGSFYLPSPICSALSCLEKMEAAPLSQTWLKQIRGCIEPKFGHLHDVLFDESVNQQVMTLKNGWPQDTLVVIYSCRKYLDDRVAAIRKTWVQDLNARDIPYVVLVGDGDGTLQGDLLALDVPDNYESLPQKSLRLFEWVYSNTNAQYVLKIDDDCYLDVAEYFDSLSYRKHYYYGRVLSREIGSTDRTWHQEKSQTLRAKNAIDKSPEPSVYADGGGGYCLSRLAIHQLINAEKSEEGQRLVANSFMEDKLVGDLLALAHIKPADEDYECYQRRRTFADAMPVARWENIFYPSAATPTKVVHLDTHLQQEDTGAIKNREELWPKKIWPTCWHPSIKLNSNQLELLTSLERFENLAKSDFFVVSVVRNEIVMLPHFLDHYRQLGVTSFIFVDNCSDDGTREHLNEQCDVILYSSDTEYKHSHYGVAWQQAVLGNLCLNKWVLLVDADELLVYEDFEQKPLSQLLEEIEAQGKNAMRTDMVDMYPYGDLSEADFTESAPFDVAGWFDKAPLKQWRLGAGWFSNRENWSSSLRHRLVPNSEPHAYVSQKYALFRYFPWVRLSQGLHYQSGMAECETPAYLAHFKYHAGFKEKVATEIERKQHYNDASEYKRYIEMLAEGKGGFGSPSVSVEFKDSHSFEQINK